MPDIRPAQLHGPRPLDELGSVNNPILNEIKRHGHFPPLNKPVGWDDAAFRKIFPTKDLPFQNVEEAKYGSTSNGENRLIWGGQPRCHEVDSATFHFFRPHRHPI